MNIKIIIGYVLKIALFALLFPYLGNAPDAVGLIKIIMIPVVYGLASYIINAFLYGGLIVGFVIVLIPILVSDYIPEPWNLIIGGILILGSFILDIMPIISFVKNLLHPENSLIEIDELDEYK